ncbi:DUF3413 domain-containing protein [Thalassotalea marina]|uniref:Choline-sulfatase n=1 Tax=Thalassotalea marina TaxID=1673741 RepID=A0A919BGT0_9GAMM|nr:DUF3413 domain-containing protein [Thalassotalea marina]GHF90396.1 choline-sulfatase [Thalassotalea marina]
MQQIYSQVSFLRWFSLYFVFNLVLVVTISTQYYQIHGWPETTLGALFSLTHSIGHNGLLLSLAMLPLIFLAFIQQAVLAQRFVVAIYATLGITLLIADTFVYQQYRFHINFMVVELFVAGGNEVISFPITMWAKIAATIIGVFCLQLSLIYAATQLAQRFNPITKPIAITIFSCYFSANIIHVWADGLFIKDVTQQAKYLPLAYPATAKRLMAKYGLLDIEAHKQQAMLKMRNQRGSLSYPNVIDSQHKLQQKPNVLWIIIDAWRPDTLTPQNMPNTYKFSQQGIQFTNHYSGSNNTRHGMFSLFYGLPGSYWDDVLSDNTVPAIYQSFQANDYQTQVYASAKLTMPEFDQTLFSSVKGLRTHSKGKTAWQRDIDAVNSLIDDYQPEKAFFNILFLDAAHGFSHPADYPKIFEPALEEPNFMALSPEYNREPFFNLYRNAVHFIDTQLAKVFDVIEQDLDNTIVVITGDHSEEFNDSKQGFWGHNSNFSRFQTQVPMIVYWPGKQPAKVDRLTSHVDLVPTFMQTLFKDETPLEQMGIGHSLFDQKPQRESVILGRKGYYAINDNRYLYELDRYGNFTIYNQEYQEQELAAPNMVEMQKALHHMSRFYR